MTVSPETFDWTSDDSIAVHEQPAIAVYANRYGQVTIRRERAWDEEDDCFVPIARENVLTIIGAILRAAEMDDVHLYRQEGALCHDIDLCESELLARQDCRPEPKDRTAAERQRRRRAKQRDGRDNDRDMNRDSVTVQEPLRLVAAE